MITKQTLNEDRILSFSEASRISGYNPDYLGSLARIGKLRAERIGRNWVISESALRDFLSQEKAKNKIRQSRYKIPVRIQRFSPPLPMESETVSAPKSMEPAPAESQPEHLLKVEVFHLARKAAEQKIKEHFEKGVQNLAHIRAAAEKMHEQSRIDEISKRFEQRLLDFENNLKNEIYRSVDQAIAQKIAASGPKAPLVPRPRAQSLAPSLQINPVPANGKPKRSPGLDPALHTPQLNLQKIEKSFEHRFALAKYLFFALAVFAIVFSAAIIYIASRQ